MCAADRADNDNLVKPIGALLDRVRQTEPRVHVLTSPVAMNLSANALLAVGATPSMTQDPEVVAAFVEGAQALIVNLGMLDPLRRASIPLAIDAARQRGCPWLLDPVKVDRTPRREAFARTLIEAGPNVLRCNRLEATNLAAGADLGGYARRHGLVLAVTGETDLVVDGTRSVRIANGHPLMDRVTAMGCAASALAGAFLAVEDDPFIATMAALLVVGVAGDLAADAAQGPGSFPVAFLDALHRLDAATLMQRSKIS